MDERRKGRRDERGVTNREGLNCLESIGSNHVRPCVWRGKGPEDCGQTWARVDVRVPPIVPSVSCGLSIMKLVFGLACRALSRVGYGVVKIFRSLTLEVNLRAALM